MRTALSVLSAMLLAAPAAAAALAADMSPSPQGSYAIVISQKTYADKDWRKVAEALKAKYGGRIIPWDSGVSTALKDLAASMPNYVCFVAQPEEADRSFVVAIHRLTRRLNDDPYTDCLWGILTGYTADDALRLALETKPLVLRKCLSGTRDGLLAPFEEGVAFDEGKAGGMVAKTADGKVEPKGCPPDSTQSIADYFSTQKPDCFITSGHASPHDWAIGYAFQGGRLAHKDGQLLALDTQGHRFPITSPNPKIYMPVGNCLIGDISGRDCMVTSLIHSAGVHQMFGYVVPTWYGQGGWGIQEYYLGQPGRFTLAEAFFANTQAMLYDLQTRFPKAAKVDFEKYDLEKDPKLLDTLAVKHGLTGRDELGLLWDRDTVAFYGDPAWQARPVVRPLAWDQEISVKGNRTTFTVTARQDGKWPVKPLVQLLPERLKNMKVVAGADRSPVVTPSFILLPLKGDFKSGDKVQIVLEAEPLKPSRLP
jgi:zinc protease